ncbi:MAG: hypothetical protein DRI90_10485 [Deltaproteobacteria bacterium]|nr:MAG: hypothetical protein DRI90_10485 [Deltaproteobacteria bacterium]
MRILRPLVSELQTSSLVLAKRLIFGVAVGFVVLSAASGCGSYLQRAETDYRDGRYLEVAEQLARRTDEVPQLSPPDQARYGLYLGLALIELRHHSGAEHWLSFTKDIVREEPGSLSPSQRALLEEGRNTLQRRTPSREPDVDPPGWGETSAGVPSPSSAPASDRPSGLPDAGSGGGS